jgi:hypothetical protein
MTCFAEDCIHLVACRRLCKIAKAYYKQINNRGCNPSCIAYEKKDEEERKYSYDEVVAVMHGACRDGAKGYDEYDLLVSDYI